MNNITTLSKKGTNILLWKNRVLSRYCKAKDKRNCQEILNSID